jgi:hypothetical protein
MALFSFILLAIPASRIARAKNGYRTLVIVCSVIYTGIVALLISGLISGSDPNWLLACSAIIVFGLVGFTWVMALRRR